MRTFLKAVGIVCFIGIVLIIIGGLGYENAHPESVPLAWATWDGEGEPPEAYIVVTTGDVARQQYATYFGNIAGVAYNRTGKNLSYIQITYGIYSESGAKLGSCLANENNIPAGTPWQFSALCTNLPDSAFRYRVEEVSYW